MSLPKFYVGQKVVAVKDHSQGVFKKGDSFSVSGVYPAVCKCPNYRITIGLSWRTGNRSCPICNIDGLPISSSERCFDEDSFESIVEKFQAITFEKIMEKELTSVN